MSEIELKKIIKKYRNRSIFILGVFLIFANGAHYYLITNFNELQNELGLPIAPYEPSFILPALCFGLTIVLSLCFYSFEKVLVEIIKTEKID
ncbi:MAG: hypothetical protein ACJA13_001550 [Paraglaciecola sp.]|jgi:hypothetical protein